MKDIYLQALSGGALIGFASMLLMLTIGKVAGISGIAFNAIRTGVDGKGWRWAFLIGLFIAPLITNQLGYSLPNNIPGSLSLLAFAGLLVGIGTKIGAGCTSGHGICGIGRLSKRSIVATLTFMGTAIATVTVVKHLL